MREQVITVISEDRKGFIMNKESLYKAFEKKYEELKAALAGDDLDRMKQLALERSNPWCPKSGS